MQQKRSGGGDALARHPVLAILAYYGTLVGVTLLVWRVLPEAARARIAESVTELMGGEPGAAAAAGSLLQGAPLAWERPASTLTAALAIVAALLLSLPIAWLYTLTRQKRGFRQSMVHSLIILPVVVAGVVVLVKHSLALAFSLAGIVAAVRFRNTLEDSKDAVYIFVATGIGLAAGVQLGVALVLSLMFNITILMLWYSDFGRSPANLEGHEAARRLQRALAIANRTGAFVARLDDEILKGMSPEQLEVLAERARRRRERLDPDSTEEQEADERAAPTRRVQLRATDPDAARRLMEETMGDHLKRAALIGIEQDGDGIWRLDYSIALRKSATTQGVLACIRSRGAENILDAATAE